MKQRKSQFRNWCSLLPKTKCRVRRTVYGEELRHLKDDEDQGTGTKAEEQRGSGREEGEPLVWGTDW